MGNIFKDTYDKGKRIVTNTYEDVKENPWAVPIKYSPIGPVYSYGTGDMPFRTGEGGDMTPTFNMDAAGPNPGDPTSFEEALARMALENYYSTKPMRDTFIGQYMDLLSGKVNPMSMPSFAPMFAAGKQATEGQYNVARENVLSNAARGGTMDRSLTDVEEARANQMSDLPAMLSQQITNDMLNKASVAAFGAPATSMAGMGNASQTQTSRLNTQMMAQAQMDAARMMAEAQGEAALWGALGGLGGIGMDYLLWAK